MEPLRGRSQAVTGIFIAILVMAAIASLSDLSILQYLREIAAG